ncbi:aquaporin-11-like [Macrosteles quadrilineatus]|uniref:aquaporin-11-like n=1 Tax=Macrosteles quadrilineatus TaxID=74068 RepID=UPI0023E2F030|nr:aquaporin-11-like [Macrosteles quadrilineatus]
MFQLNSKKASRREGPGAYHLAVSTGFIVLTSLIAFWLRKLLDRVFPESTLTKVLLLELIAAGELCACCFELIIVADNFGVGMYAIFLFLLTIWWSMNWGDATACPYTHLEEVVEGNINVLIAGAKIFAEMAGGLLIFKYIQFLWQLEVSSTHKGRAFERCSADLQVSPIAGAIIEGIATCLCRLASRAIGEVGPKYAAAYDSFVGTSLVVAAFNYSGGYFNPVLASALKFGCKGHTHSEHVFVYWIGACTGAILSVFLYHNSRIQSIINKFKVKTD